VNFITVEFWVSTQEEYIKFKDNMLLSYDYKQSMMSSMSAKELSIRDKTEILKLIVLHNTRIITEDNFQLVGQIDKVDPELAKRLIGEYEKER